MFSNSTEWDIWSWRWCRLCVNDVDGECPIVTNLLMHRKDDNVVSNGPRLSDIVCNGFVRLSE
jgi:hypothetical protein